jgi:hypothetical protein
MMLKDSGAIVTHISRPKAAWLGQEHTPDEQPNKACSHLQVCIYLPKGLESPGGLKLISCPGSNARNIWYGAWAKVRLKHKLQSGSKSSCTTGNAMGVIRSGCMAPLLLYGNH